MVLHPKARARGLSAEYPRLYPVAGIHLIHKLLGIVSSNPVTLDQLATDPNNVTFDENIRHPRQRIAELIRFAAALQLVHINALSVSLTEFGRRYHAARAGSISSVSDAQAGLLRDAISEAPEASYTFYAIATLCRIALQSARIGPDTIKDVPAIELHAERLGSVTRRAWASWAQKCCDQLGLISEGRITPEGRALVGAISRSTFEHTVAPGMLPPVSSELPKRRKYQIGKVVEWTSDAPKPMDQEAWHQVIERRAAEHRALTDLIAASAEAANKSYAETAYIDLWVGDDVIVEVKSLKNGDVKQARAALAQLLHYRHFYRDELIKEPILVAGFSRRPLGTKDELVDLLTANGVFAIWPCEGGFTGSPGTAALLPWLCSE